MLRSLALALIFSLVGCLHSADYTDDHEARCAKMGMFYGGFDVVGTNSNGQDVGHVKCEKPDTEEERCLVGATSDRMAMSDKFEGKWWPRRVGVGLGYVLWILPGAGLYYMWDDENRQDYAALMASSRERYDTCKKTETAH